METSCWFGFEKDVDARIGFANMTREDGSAKAPFELVAVSVRTVRTPSTLR